MNNINTKNQKVLNRKAVFVFLYSVILFISTSLFTAKANAEQNNSFTLLLGQSSNQYFEEYPSSLDTDTKGLVYTHSFNDKLTIAMSGQKSDGNGRWTAVERDNFSAYNQAETESSGYAISSSWSGENYTFDASYHQNESREQSLSWLPRVIERLESESHVFDFSLSRSIVLSNLSNTDQLSFDWSLGIQQADFNAEIIDVIGTDALVIVRSDVQLTQLSSFVDVGLSWWLENSKFAWSPYINLDWNFELETSGQQTALLSRGGDERSVNLLDGRFTSEINIPDSGEWQLGLALLFDSGWSFDISYSQTVSTEYPNDKIFTSVSVFF